MAWKYRRWKIKWNPKKRKFRKIKRDRTLSRKAHLRFKQNRGKMMMALRKSRIKGRITMKKNKAMGMYKKLSIARKRYKNILKSDINIDKFFDMMLYEEKYSPEMELDFSDLDHIEYALKQIQRNVEFDDKEIEKEVKQHIDDIIIRLNDYEDILELDDDDRNFLSDIISIIEEFGEEAGFLDDEEDK